MMIRLASGARRAAALLACALALGPLAPAAATPPSVPGPANVTIVYQPGLSYSNLIVMRERGVLERQFPATHIEWKVLASTAAIRDGFIAGQIQIGAGSVPPFLTGWDRGVNWKVLASLNQMSVWLSAKDPALKTLKDIKPDMKIGMPSPDSIQALTLRKAAAEQLGNAHALDQNIVAIDHPTGLQALLNGQLSAHLSAPPFEYQEVAAGAHVVIKSFDLFGRHTFNNVYVDGKFADENAAFVRQFYRDLLDATEFIKAKPKEAAQILSKDSGGKVPALDFERWIRRPDVIFSTTPHGFMQIARFMQSIGALSRVPGSMREIEWLPALGGVGD